MLFKISVKNIKKSIKDYSIYFFTLVFAVSMFYMFNSIDAQTSMLALNESKYEIIKALVQLISYVSIFVSIILGFLIVYSNNFLIKRRKKEIGMYEILGMSKRKVSLILVFETILVGVLSLMIGLGAGILLSQFLSIFVSKLFEVDITSLKFIFSKVAFNKTILYFGIIFLLVVIFNVITLNRYKLIDLINAEKKNEKVKIRNKYLVIASFVLSLAFLAYGYYQLIVGNALLTFDYRLILTLVTGAIGTFLLFFSLSGFLVKVFGRIKRVYYKDLNLFTLKQVNSKINTTVVSTTVICLMLLLTIGLLSGSLSMAKVFNTDFAANNLTDYTIKAYNTATYVNEEGSGEVMTNGSFEKFESFIESPNLKNYTTEYVVFHKYGDPKLRTKQLLKQEDIDKLKKEYGSSLSLDFNIPLITETEYKEFMDLTNQKHIDIKPNEYLLLCNIDFIISAYQAHYEEKIPVTINNQVLLPATDHIIKAAYENYNTAGNDGIIVVSDEIVKGLDVLSITLVGNFVPNNDPEKIGEDLNKYLAETTDTWYDFRTREAMEASSLGLKTITIFLGLYLGITFAISSATVLAIGQLSESSDNKKRYKVLSQIGADTKMINKALFTQIAITFAFPLVVALIHGYFGLRELNSVLVSIGSIDLTSNILYTTLFMVIVYGGYFLLTYWCSKSIIKTKDNN